MSPVRDINSLLERKRRKERNALVLLQHSSWTRYKAFGCMNMLLNNLNIC